MMPLSQRRAREAARKRAAGESIEVTKDQATRLRDNLRFVLTFIEKNWPGSEATHHGMWFKNAREALRGDFETSEGQTGAAFCLLSAVDYVMKKAEGRQFEASFSLDQLADSFALLSELGLMESTEVAISPPVGS